MTTATTDAEAIARIIRLAIYDGSAGESSDERVRIAETYAQSILSYLASRREAQEPDWHDDPSADERWQAGCDFVLERLCGALNVDPKQVRWDAATETLDGDVVAVICDILRQRFGDDFDPFITAPPSPAGEVERLRKALEWAVVDIRAAAVMIEAQRGEPALGLRQTLSIINAALNGGRE